MNQEYGDTASQDKLIRRAAPVAVMAVLSSCDSADVIHLENATGLTRGSLSTHLSKLEEAGHIEIEKNLRGKFPHTTCRLTA